VPVALHANPEAYGELRRALLLLVYGQAEGGSSPVSGEWSDRARADLAGMLARTLRQAAGRVSLHNPHSGLDLLHTLKQYGNP
jgi:hypothetical protein